MKTLKDEIAIAAMQAILTGIYTNNKPASPDDIAERFELVSKNAYFFAEAMLKERDKRDKVEYRL